jgi:hypothetical protein
MDSAKRASLLAHVESLATELPEAPVVTAAHFFDGNDDDASIAANLPEHPGALAFRDLVARVEREPGVAGVLVAITDPMDGDEGSWPYTDTLYILTSATPAAVREWFAAVSPDEVEPGWGTASGDPPAGAPRLAAGIRPVRVWWD